MPGPRRRLGVRYDVRDADGGVAAPAVYARLLEHAEGAEALGVDVLWVAERPFVRGALLPAAFPLCAALAARTRRARIATGALPLPLHHPLRVAEDAAVLDVLSRGRFELGVGLGEHAEGFDGFGIPVHERAGRFEEAVDLLRRAWSETPVRFEGRHYTVTDVTVHPRPVQRPHPPLWVAGAGAAVRRAARLGTGLLTDDVAAALRFLEVDRTGEASVALHLGGPDPEARRADALRATERLSGAPSLDLVLPGPAAGEAPDAALRALEPLVRELRSTFAAATAIPSQRL
jgi:alkanesulfonate monooxygenase SsuD/methylene tetrahydromethanopterin reductase-like flavin-dependent oxidoreductase (luciferase family)